MTETRAMLTFYLVVFNGLAVARGIGSGLWTHDVSLVAWGVLALANLTFVLTAK